MQTCSKIFLTLLAAAWLAGCGQAKQNEEADEKAIRNVVHSYQEAYNQQDATKLVAQWASDANYINPVTGESAEGREAIEKLFKEKFAQGKKRRLEITIKSIEFPYADEAIENGVMKVTVDDQPAQHVAYQARYVKANGKWLVKAINEIELQEPTSNFEQLKDLTWMVGKWEDSDDNVDILFDNQWDKYKNFITQNFKMKIYGQDDIEGKQIIAWDPVKDVVRSWVFDLDGGFGEGTWKKVDKSWYATMRFTLGDGRVASSINIYTPVDDHSYTFASVEREVDGEILPDMNPVTVEKIE
jgi:uncharacterized protein (TIGR02246 family)